VPDPDSDRLILDDVTLTSVDPRSDLAVSCLTRYYAELARRLETGFDVELSRDPEAAQMMPPRGAFLLALSRGAAIGCAGLKGHTEGVGAPWGEVKRVWVDPAARGLRLASQLMAEIETRARGLGFAHLRLDTNAALPEAFALYRRLGWHEIPRFNDDPYPDAFFEKRL